MTPDEILEVVRDCEEEIIQFPDLKDALIGWSTPWQGRRSTVLAYSARKCIECMMKDGMSEEEAREWLELNTEGSYLGPNTPIIIHDC